jgi:hypothetical protein
MFAWSAATGRSGVAVRVASRSLSAPEDKPLPALPPPELFSERDGVDGVAIAVGQ